MGPPLHWYTLCKSGVDFGFWGVDLSPCNVVMSWMRLQQASDWIPHPYWMYTKCFGTLICWVWAYGATLTVIRLWRSRVDFGVWSNYLDRDTSTNSYVGTLSQLDRRAVQNTPLSGWNVNFCRFFNGFRAVLIFSWQSPCIKNVKFYGESF